MGDRVRDLPAFGDLAPPSTLTVMNLVAPSPSRTMAWASSRASRTRLPQPGLRRCRAGDVGLPARWVAIRTNESLVEVSPSMVMRLNDRRPLP